MLKDKIKKKLIIQKNPLKNIEMKIKIKIKKLFFIEE
jgi:hypothetical protein